MTKISEYVLEQMRRIHRSQCGLTIKLKVRVAEAQERVVACKQELDESYARRSDVASFLMEHGVPVEELDKERDNIDDCLSKTCIADMMQ